jgi:ADP-ribose pyrophosphatase YjhB (NUDIX family)
MRKDTSAGCCVVRKLDDRYQLLTIFRKWPDRKKGYTLPKGHKENNDSLEQTAIRETQEET